MGTFSVDAFAAVHLSSHFERPCVDGVADQIRADAKARAGEQRCAGDVSATGVPVHGPRLLGLA